MKKIQMVDLQSQYLHIKEEIDKGIQEVIDTASFVKGGKVTDFQHHLESYTGAKHVIPVGNRRAADSTDEPGAESRR